MFSSDTYKQRRKKLIGQVGTGLILLPANDDVPSNYPKNTFPFRQDSTFLYYCGIDLPGIFLLLNTQTDKTILYGDEQTIDDTIWTGPVTTINELAEKSGIDKVLPLTKLASDLAHNKVHYLAPYQSEIKLKVQELLNIPVLQQQKLASQTLVSAVVNQRSVKEEQEIEQIEQALNTASIPMHKAVMQHAKNGTTEAGLVSLMHKKVAEKEFHMAFQPICSIRGEVLHNTTYSNILQTGNMLLVDAGAENRMHYASDITRTTPVDGKFNAQQKEIYSIVLDAQLTCINKLKAGMYFKDIHFLAADTIAKGLKELGLIKCTSEEAVEKNIHTLFFPHGIGHMLGLDVHDMENLGEDNVGYDKTIQRSTDFGTAYLRLAKKVEANNIVTIEPGIYFIPALIEKWKQEKIFPDKINYKALENYYQFGGIRIEDTVHVQPSGAQILGDSLPKTIAEIETLCK